MTNLGACAAHSLVEEMNPHNQAFLDPLMLPSVALFDEYNIQVAALVAFQRIAHIKCVPAYWMLLAAHKAGKLKGIHTIVVDSSGNTAHAVARLAPALGYKVKVILSTDVPSMKRALLEALSSVEVISVPGGVARRAKEEGSRPGHFHLDQYADPMNLDSHYRFTAPAIFHALKKWPAVIAIAMGTGGTAGGVAKYNYEHRYATKIIGARPVEGQDIPGTRDKLRMRESTVAWQEHIDPDREIIEVTRRDAFIETRRLWSQALPQVGPTSGLASVALQRYFRKLSVTERKALHGMTIAFLCPDDGRFYSEPIAAELRPEQGRDE